MLSEKYILEKSLDQITQIARDFGLDFFNMHFEICPADILYTFGAYGMPARFSHWSFGKAYHKMKTQYDYNLNRLYEMVINSDPCYAFLLEGNSIVQNKMVMAHVLAHCDFFKNNIHFQNTNRKMIESMSVSAQRIRDYEFSYGKDRVESFLDSVICLQEHIDFYSHIGKEKSSMLKSDPVSSTNKVKKAEAPYNDLWQMGEKEQKTGSGEEEKNQESPENTEKDVLCFIMEYGRDLENWQRDIISIIREEMFYFWPQMQTKIMNEGWATYWHSRIMRELDLDEDESLEFAKLHASVIQHSKTTINPYHLGLKLLEDIENRWDEPSEEEKVKYGRAGSEGRDKIFEVRELDNDVSFLRNYLSKNFIEQEDLYLYRKIGQEWKVVEKNWQNIRDGLVANIINGGFPYIIVEDGDFEKRGELYLKHVFEGNELDIYYLERTLPHVYKLWGRPAHLETVLDNKRVLFSYNGDKVSKKFC
ncbi:MAG: SpoVR family protein [Clostridiales bacterium]|nr:SpoVR family protein [Clostridiales bacterium]MCF8022129.1 SpoVR family protein [Clostridiales bacterium]